MATASNKSVFSMTPQGLDVVKTNWAWFFGLGAALIVLGIVAISVPLAVSLAAEILCGWLFLIAGIAHVIHAFRCKGWSGVFWSLLAGFLFAIAGWYLVTNPGAGVIVLTLVVAAMFLAEGIFKFVMAFQVRPMQNWGWLAVNGVVSFLLGALIWSRWPGDAAWVIGLLVGIDMIVGGAAMIAVAFSARDFKPENQTPATT
jgi:uncharacterized membrane protein HdeD (DUF308 family)